MDSATLIHFHIPEQQAQIAILSVEFFLKVLMKSSTTLSVESSNTFSISCPQTSLSPDVYIVLTKS
jgi:hypothetical protein